MASRWPRPRRPQTPISRVRSCTHGDGSMVTSAFSDIPNYVLDHSQPTLSREPRQGSAISTRVSPRTSPRAATCSPRRRRTTLFSMTDSSTTSSRAVLSCPCPTWVRSRDSPSSAARDCFRCEGIVKGDSIADVAKGLGLDPDVLESTVERYNGFCDSGIDEDYGKPKEQLLAVSKAPFYGAKITPTLFTTVGGLRVDERMRVMSTSGNPISACMPPAVMPLVYTVRTTTSMCGSGSQQGWAATSGVLAAEDAWHRTLAKQLDLNGWLPNWVAARFSHIC